jgi:hypothetical protein
MNVLVSTGLLLWAVFASVDESGPTTSLQLRDAKSREPIAGACASVLSGKANGRFPIAAISDEQGALSVSAAIGDIIELSAPGYAPTWHDVTSTATGTTPVELTRPAWLQLRVIAPGVDRLRAFLEPKVTVTFPGLQGERSIGRPSASQYEETHDQNPFKRWGIIVTSSPEVWGLPAGQPLRVQLGCGGQIWFDQTLTLVPGENRREALLTYRSTLRGKLVDQDENPVSGWSVGLAAPAMVERSRPNCNPLLEVLTATDGSFEMPAMPGRWWLGPTCFCAISQSKPEVADHERSQWLTAFGQWTDVAVGTTLLTTDVTADRGQGVRGRVLSPDGKPVAGLQVYVMNDRCLHRQAVELGGASQTTDHEGRFDLRPLPIGIHRIRTAWRLSPGDNSPPNWVHGPLEVATGSTDVVLSMVSGCELMGRVVDSRTGRPVAADIHLLGPDKIRSRSDGRGKFHVQALLPGRYDVLVRAPDQGLVALRQDVELQASSATDIVLPLEPAARVRIVNSTLRWVRYELDWSLQSTRTLVSREEARLGSVDPQSILELQLPGRPLTLHLTGAMGTREHRLELVSGGLEEVRWP